MSSLFSPILSSAFQLLLVNRLQNAIDRAEKLEQPANPDDQTHSLQPHRASIECDSIPIKRVRDATQTWYVSAIAFQRAARQHQPALDIAHHLADRLIDGLKAANEDPVWQHLTVEVTEPGWIHLRLSDAGLAHWLQTLVNQPNAPSYHFLREPSSLTEANNGRDSTRVFHLLYTHARCCSLLRLGMREGLIQFSSDIECIAQPIQQPNPLPWLTAAQALRSPHLSERQLIFQIMTTLDDLATPPNAQRHSQSWKLAQKLCQSFQTFYAACPIVGVSGSDLPLAQVRLGIVLVTQRVLRSLLQDELALPAPSEL